MGVPWPVSSGGKAAISQLANQTVSWYPEAMRFEVTFVPSANQDLEVYTAREQQVILDAIANFLETDANVESKRRKQLRPNPVAPWELRIGNYRVFYEIREAGLVRVLAIGHKVHNELFIRGQRIEI
jgi:mRNA-degrading endonuclease RelE of RelBE toxin-antitoxin system